LIIRLTTLPAPLLAMKYNHLFHVPFVECVRERILATGPRRTDWAHAAGFHTISIGITLHHHIFRVAANFVVVGRYIAVSGIAADLVVIGWRDHGFLASGDFTSNGAGMKGSHEGECSEKKSGGSDKLHVEVVIQEC
jgi:hypothetical protein